MADLVTYYLAIRSLRYAITAAFSIMVFEWFSNLTDEVRLIHNSRWSTVKVAYLLCRYYPLLANPVLMWAYLFDYDRDFCKSVIQPVHALFTPFHVFPQAIMIIRASAFVGNKWVVGGLSGLYAAFVAVTVWVFCTGATTAPAAWYELAGESGCFANYEGDVMGVRLGVVLLGATLMDFLSLCIVSYYCRRAALSRWGLARYFIRQGLVSFISVSLANGLAAILYFQTASVYSRMGLPFSFTICNIVACRLTLQLHEQANKQEVRRNSNNMEDCVTGATIPGDDKTVQTNPHLSQWRMDFDDLSEISLS